jgi:hypothetical protein
MSDPGPPTSEHAAIACFVRDTLGCSCPDETLRRIRLSDGRGGAAPRGVSAVVEVGGRLLIYLVDGRRLQPATVTDVAVAGRHARDAQGFNRFRLVLAGAGDGGPEAAALTAAFQAAAGADDRAHLHAVPARDLPDSLKVLIQPRPA